MKSHFCFLLIVLMVLAEGCKDEVRQYEKANALYEEGQALSDSNQTVSAADKYNEALLVLEQCNKERLDVKRLKGQIKDQLGAIYWKQGMKEEALALYQDAIEIFRQLPGSVLLMNALQNAGRVAASLQYLDQAQQYYEETLQLAKTQHNKKYYEILLEFCRDVLMEIKDYNKVVEMVTEAMESGMRSDLCHLTLGMAYYYTEADKPALEHLTLATQSKKTNVRMSAYQGLYLIYELQKNYPKALECLKKYNENMILAHDEQHNEEMQRIKRDYDLEMQKNTLQAEQKMKSFYLFLVLGLLVVVLAMTLLFFRQKTLKNELKNEESQHQLDVAMWKNKVFVTAWALSEKIIGDTMDFNLEESEWNEYLELIDVVYSDFTLKLLEHYPSLTKTDLQICSLTRQGFSNQVISIMMNMQTNSYARRKSRIKQEKMNGLEDERNFEEIINSL